MLHHLHYGSAAEFGLEDTPDIRVASFTTRGRPLQHLATEVATALAKPLNYPPLELASTPGDRVVLALDQGVPGASEIVVGAVEVLLRAGVDPADITLLVGGSGPALGLIDRGAESLPGLPPAVRSDIRIEHHDLRDRKKLAYLAASRDAEPIYLNRGLVDADVVLPISQVSLASSWGYLGVHGGLFPLFSDEATVRRFRDPAAVDQIEVREELKQQCDEVAWLLGALFAIQVVPGPRQSVLHVLAGEAQAVQREGQRLAASAWVHETPFRASLVVATISGGEPQQSWRNFARALYTATQAAAERSDIVLCTELHSVPWTQPARSLGAADSATPGLDQEGLCTQLLARTQRHSRVFLLSQLESDVVEDLGLAYVSNPHEIQRLSRHHHSWLLLEDAQNAVVRPSA